MSTAPIVVVTGANQGIGYCIAKQLVAVGARVVMACRSRDKAAVAAEQIMKEPEIVGAKTTVTPPVVARVDLSDVTTFPTFVEELKEKQLLHQGTNTFDHIIHNAAILLDQPTLLDAAIRQQQVQEMMDVNVFNTIELTKVVSPLVTGRVIYVSSYLGGLDQGLPNKNGPLRIPLDFDRTGKVLPYSEIQKLAQEYIQAVGLGLPGLKAKGLTVDNYYPMYSATKVFLNAAVRSVAAQADGLNCDQLYRAQHIVCEPGWVRTNMTGGQGTSSPDEGADTPAWLTGLLGESTAPKNGHFYGSRKELSYVTGYQR